MKEQSRAGLSALESEQTAYGLGSKSSPTSTFLHIDNITTSVAKGRFARICVRIDLDKPLMPHITIGKFIQNIQYENIPMLCYNCGILGHT